MSASGPESPEMAIVAIRLSRPTAAGHPALADPAGHRPKSVFRNLRKSEARFDLQPPVM
jgi:hypothetical protein